MAIVFLKEKKKEKYLIFALAIVLLITIIVIWRGFFIKPSKLISSPAPKPPEIKINFEILKRPILKDLQPFEEIKPFGESAGRENPFAPY